ncbi:MAG: zinc ABC transporter substrate-binding protein, partial [Gordonia sp. (in: high G+C Gram-positive bacteria)]
HGEVNEHVFYNLAVVEQTATTIADALASQDSANADAYRTNATTFTGEVDKLRTQLTAIKTAHSGTKVIQTEPLALYLLADAGLVDVAPESFTSAVEEGQSPSAADRAAMQDLLTHRTAHALIYNTQAVDSVTESLLGVAQTAGVPVVKFTETLPEGVTSYIAWQKAQIEALTAALDQH